MAAKAAILEQTETVCIRMHHFHPDTLSLAQHATGHSHLEDSCPVARAATCPHCDWYLPRGRYFFGLGVWTVGLVQGHLPDVPVRMGPR